MTTTPLISIEVARAHLNLAASSSPADDGSDDAELFDAIVAATEIINSEKGYSAATSIIEQVPVTGATDSYGRAVLRLTSTPVQSVQSIADVDGTTVSTSGLVIPSSEAGLVAVPGVYVCGPLTVTYTAGRSSIPADLQQACKLLVQWLWDTQRGGIGANPMAGEQVGQDEDADGLLAQAHYMIERSPESASPGFA